MFKLNRLPTVASQHQGFSRQQQQIICVSSFTFWIFVVSSDIHTAIAAHSFGADRPANDFSVTINSFLRSIIVHNPSVAVGVHLWVHKQGVVIQAHFTFFDG